MATRTRPVKLLQLKVELHGVRPKVWRRVLVKSSIRLSKLHQILIGLMGWEGYHLHEFDFVSGRYGVPDADWPDEALDDQSRISLGKALGDSASFTWTYDFGDHWVHMVRLERTEHAPAMFAPHFPMCLTGAGACPPEDVGGIHAYEEFLQILSNPKHPEHQRMLEWVGRPFDPHHFDPAEAQARLDRIRM